MKELIQHIDELYAKATPGEWCVESCGEKGDGADIIGVAFSADDVDCEKPLAGRLAPFDENGAEIEYYRDEEVAVVEHRTRNATNNSEFIAALHNAWPLLRDALERMQKDAWIPVSERFPHCSHKPDSFGTPVLVYQPANKERQVFEAFYGRRITKEPNFYLYGALLDGVTHWMPLPEPPIDAAQQDKSA